MSEAIQRNDRELKDPNPVWLRRILVIAGCVGPFVGAALGSLATSQGTGPLELIETLGKEIKGPLGGYMLAFIMLVTLAWHHSRVLAKHEEERKDRSRAMRSLADRLEARIAEKDQKLEEATDKTITVFRGTVDRYEKILNEVNARTDQTVDALTNLRAEIQRR